MALVLLVEDDLDQLEIRKLLLEHSGYMVLTAGSPKDAVAVCDQLSPELAVMDLRLPKVEDGLELIRAFRSRDRSMPIVVLSGWAGDFSSCEEAQMVDRFLMKPVRAGELLDCIKRLAVIFICCMILALGSARAGESFPFKMDQSSEVVADIEMSSPGADWSRAGREAALATITLDDKMPQFVMLYAGDENYRYSVFLGPLDSTEHRLAIERNEKYSAPGARLKVSGVQFRPSVPSSGENYAVLANAPVLFARQNTIGKFTDVPLLVYCERLQENGQAVLAYSVIFSNEDGGTSTRGLMARWGRTTDVEYIYKAYLNSDGSVPRATIQGRNHQEIEFRGKREGAHPLLIPITDNNMVGDDGFSEIRYQIAPVIADLSNHSRELVMDQTPVTYRMMAQELVREKKLRTFGMVDGEKVGDPLNYLYLEMKIRNRNSAVATLVRLRNDSRWRSSHLGRSDYAIERDGWARTTVELPPGTNLADIADIGFECLVVQPSRQSPMPLSGECRIDAVSKGFLLDATYHPAKLLSGVTLPKDGLTIPSGEIRSLAVP